MSTLSQKLAGIVLPTDKYSSHLNSQGEDPIFGQQVITKYTDQRASPFDDVTFSESNYNNTDKPTWRWLENYTKIYQYSIDIRKFIKRNNGHYLNSLHVLEFYNIDKLPGYDMHCYFLINYSNLCCSICDAYFPTGSMVIQHIRNQHPK
ncbi:17707_t:CDS:2 [Cetraspora pellucida]|uniref:17707_t:CDS:1 n=1 Tax=Cetraspora pellucida TaxID=1433469 RepID=A0A9N9GA51_9GLOM|nr:17707_t:CDS:2 [Cetraspora pellucida]